VCARGGTWSGFRSCIAVLVAVYVAVCAAVRVAVYVEGGGIRSSFGVGEVAACCSVLQCVFKYVLQCV